MKNDIKIYIFLFLVVAVQVSLMSRIRVFPDLIVVFVVYSSVFYDLKNVLLISFAAGFLRGVFSFETISIDLVIFPVIGGVSYGIGKLFTRNNPVGGVIISSIMVLFLLFFHTIMLNAVNQNNISISFVFVEHWRMVLLSAISYPFEYFLLNIFLKSKKNTSDNKRIFY